MTVNTPTKPAEGQPCNGCGLCCRIQVCRIGELAFGPHAAPCAALRWDGVRHRCRIVEVEAKMETPPVLAIALGIGWGCDSSDEGITS